MATAAIPFEVSCMLAAVVTLLRVGPIGRRRTYRVGQNSGTLLVFLFPFS